MRFVLKLEIETVMHVLDVQTLLSSIMLNDQLLKEKEGTLVVNSLSHLNLGHPQVRCVSLFTILALLISDDEFDDEALLK
jgi:hypothetical protein